MLKELEELTPQLADAAPEPHPGFPRPDAPVQSVVLQARHIWLGLGCLLVALTALNLLTLLRTPPPFVDEGWDANRAWGLLHTGRPFGTLDAGVFEKYPGYWTYFPWLGTAIHAVALALFGPQLIATRLVSMLFGVVLLIAVFVIAKRLVSPRAGFMAVVLVALSFSFLYSSHLGRHDIIVTALGFTAIALYVTDDGQGFTIKSLLSGLAVGLTPDIHLNGIIYIPVIAALYLYDFRLGVFKSKRFWGYVVGVVAGVAFFVVLHILPYPQTFFTLFSIGNGTGRTPPLLTLDPSYWIPTLLYPVDLLGLSAPLVGLAIIYMLWRRSVADKKLLFICFMLFLVFMVIIRGKPIFYGILVAPAAYLLLASFLDALSRMQWRGSVLGYARTVLIWSLTGAALLLGAVPLLIDSTGDTQVTFAGVKQAVAPGSSVMGPQTYWYAVPDQAYYSWEQIVYYRRDNPGSTLEDAFHALHPDYLIIDRFMEGAVRTDAELRAERIPFLYVPKADLDKFLAERARLVSSVETQTFGNVRVYKINWNGAGGFRGKELLPWHN